MLFKKTKTLPCIKIIDSWQKSNNKFATGALVEVTNGKGLLHEVYSQTNDSSYLTLMFGSQTLFQLQGDEYFCPTCEKMMRSGYCLEQTQEFKQDILNKDKNLVSFLEALDGIKPVLGLLNTGYYVIIETQLYPTDGNGHLFCEVPGSNKYLPGTCIYYYGNGIWGSCWPYFTVATQPQQKICLERVNYYMENPGGRALAYYMDGYMTALIDGHHKTLAAAKLHKKIDALVIMPCHKMQSHNEDNSIENYIYTNGFKWNCKDYGLDWDLQEPYTRAVNKELEEIIKNTRWNNKNTTIGQYKHLVSYYPDVEDVASIDIAGEITETRIDNILNGVETIDEDYIIYFVRAVKFLEPGRIKELTSFFLSHGISLVQRCLVVKELFTLEKTDELVDYLIDILVEYEDDYPEIKDLILGYL